jgi:hypothetical protein
MSDTPEPNTAVRKAPYISVGWMERFFDVIQRINPQIVDNDFLASIAKGNEGKVLSALRFLNIIDSKGKPTPHFPNLRLVGERRKQSLKEMVNEAYGDLIKEVDTSVATRDDLVNYFVRTCSYNQNQADRATNLFTYLAREAGLTLSEEAISSAPAPTPRDRPDEKRRYSEQSQRTKVTNRKPATTSVQTIVNIHLDKDTPKELWDRVLKILGEDEDETQ